MAWLMASTTSGRVSLGAHTAYQAVTSKPGMPISAMLGVGQFRHALLVETASARSFAGADLRHHAGRGGIEQVPHGRP